MNTTAIFAEILIIGVVAIIGTLVGLASIFGIPSGTIDQFRDWAVPASLAVVAIAYPIGIAVDRLTDSLWKTIEDAWFASEILKSEGLTEQEMRFRVWAVAPSRVLEFLDYARSRRRVSRSVAAIAFPIAVVSAATASKGLAHLMVSGAALAVGSGCAYAWWRIGKMYDSRLTLSYRIDVEKRQPGAGNDLGW